jgi:hypothetical protein
MLNYLRTTPRRRVGEWRYSSAILYLSISWKRVVSLTPRLLYPREMSLRYPLNRRLGGRHSRCGRRGEEKNLSPAGNSTKAVQPIIHRYIDWAIPIPQGHIVRSVKCFLEMLHSHELSNARKCTFHCSCMIVSRYQTPNRKCQGH